MTSVPTVLLLSGSLRAHSTNTAVLRTAQAVTPAGLHTVLSDDLGALPHFNPDDDHDPLPPAVAAFRARLRAADALLFCTPEYAGGLPGAFKNLLDWTVGGGETYGRPAAWINVSGVAAPTGGEDAHAALRKVLGYTGVRVVEAACRRLPLARQDVGADGLIASPEVRAHLQAALLTLAAHA
ncbi:NADPH-dependent FMN reductase [Deinococcus maricopensis]|uniref:NADPH-dependent FMN reductase n=1 Tax=Deinococcus maricopensis (strain DSM 21211 / LMG 22137 / NRRL B-23946 / LB-34) TaxID=709986 RepID=E8U4N2_DEIML|nr:NADPH-dependent FMN reductase [Deinococcus maricopensis]ADV68897.1 NADPH-dependent FMN reductase [Deinococcus maricopensis DSM 21211]